MFRLLALLAFVPTSVIAHGGVVDDGDLCLINIGYLQAHFKIYVPEERRHEDYCEDIPVRGESVFVMEYVHDGLSEAAIDFRIIRNVTGKGRFANLDDIEAIDDLDAVTIRYEPPMIVPDVFTMLQSFEEDGEFIGIVSARRTDTQKVYTAVFPFEVGYTGIGYWPVFLAGLLLLQLNYWYLSRRRARKITTATTALMLFAMISPDAIAQDDESWTSDEGHFTVRFESALQPLSINKIHSWVLHIADSDGNAISNAELVVTGGMPQHNHGLPTSPAVTVALEDGDYKVEGMRFHMRGYWEIRVSIDTGTESDDVTIALTL